MNPIILYFASGESLYIGIVLLAVLAVISALSHRPFTWVWRSLVWIALALMIMACPPFPWIADALFAMAFLAWVISLNRWGRHQEWIRTCSVCILIVVLIAFAASELIHRRIPVVYAGVNDHLVVMGDSISAGIGGNVQPWPEVMRQRSGMEVKNLSKAGATVADGLIMANQVVPQDRLILIELGGNDLISGEPAELFARSLEGVLKRLSAPGRTLVMFELPLVPTAIAYGKAQRRLANRYGVVLIPKRCFAAVLSGKEATSDGLHLSSVGIERMAFLVAEIFTHDGPNPTGLATHP